MRTRRGEEKSPSKQEDAWKNLSAFPLHIRRDHTNFSGDLRYYRAAELRLLGVEASFSRMKFSFYAPLLWVANIFFLVPESFWIRESSELRQIVTFSTFLRWDFEHWEIDRIGLRDFWNNLFKKDKKKFGRKNFLPRQLFRCVPSGKLKFLSEMVDEIEQQSYFFEVPKLYL